MHAINKAALIAALATASLSANAAETHIKVWADVDSNVALMRADGSALPDAVKLAYNPVSGLNPWTEQVRIYSNDTDKDIEVRLANAPSLLSLRAGATPVPLTVSLNTKALTVAPQDFAAADLFDGAMPGASIAMPLRIAQTNQAPITVAGEYQGMVSIVMQQKTTSP